MAYSTPSIKSIPCTISACYFVLVICVPGTAFAQPDWVKDVLKEIVTLSPAESATEITLFSTENVELNSEGHARSHIRMMTKCLRTPGPTFGMILELKNANRDIRHIKGWRIPRVGEMEKLSDENVAVVSPPSDIAEYDESHTLVAQFPETAEGDIIAYEYDVEDNDWPASHQSHTFQIQQPVHYSEFTITLPKNWSLHKSEWNLGDISAIQKENAYSWIARDLPLRPEEHLMPPWSYLERRVTVDAYNIQDNGKTSFSDWKSIAHWVRSISDPALTPTDSLLNGEVKELTSKLHSSTDKIRALGEYVRDQVRYVAVEIGKGRWEPHSCSSILYNKYGDCKDKTTLMRAMLNAINIPSRAVLANASYNVHPDLPSPFQFNHMIVAIPLDAIDSVSGLLSAISGRWFFFDPTDEASSFGVLPVVLQGSTVLVATEGDSVLMRLPYGEPQDNIRRYRASLAVQENGSLLGQIRLSVLGALSHRVRHDIKTTSKEDQMKPLQRFYSSLFPDITISEYTTGENEDSVWMSFRLNAPKGLRRSENTMFLKPNIFPTKEFPALPRSSRQHPIWFGGPGWAEADVTIELPQGWTFEEPLPAQKDSCMNVAHLSYKAIANKNKLHFTSQTDTNGELIETHDYEKVRGFSKQMRSYNELTLMVHVK